MSQKTKSLLIIVVFIALLIMPVCYALIRNKLQDRTEAKKEAPAAPAAH